MAFVLKVKVFLPCADASTVIELQEMMRCLEPLFRSDLSSMPSGSRVRTNRSRACDITLCPRSREKSSSVHKGHSNIRRNQGC